MSKTADRAETDFQAWWERQISVEPLCDIIRGIALQAWYEGANWSLLEMQKQLREDRPDD